MLIVRLAPNAASLIGKRHWVRVLQGFISPLPGCRAGSGKACGPGLSRAPDTNAYNVKSCRRGIKVVIGERLVR